MDRQLGTVARHRIVHRRPNFPIFDADFRGLDLRLDGYFINLHRFGKRIDLFRAFHITHFVENRRRIDELGLRKSFADLLPGAVEDRALRRARAFDLAEAGDADAPALEV